MTSRVIVRCVGHTGPSESLVVPLRDGATVKDLLKAIRHRATNKVGLEALYLEDEDGVVYPGFRLHSADICGRVAQSVVVSGDRLVAAPRPARAAALAGSRSRSRPPGRLAVAERPWRMLAAD